MKTEKTLTVLALLGIVLKLMHIPGGAFLLIVSLGILSMVYFPFGFYFLSGKTFRQQNIGLSVGIGIALAVPVTAILFKLMHWPGAAVLLLVGLISGIPLLFVVRSVRSKNTLEDLDDSIKIWPSGSLWSTRLP